MIASSKMEMAKFACRMLAWLGVVVLFVAGCSSPLSASSEPTATSPAAVQVPKAAQSYVEMSASALAQQLNISQDQIELESVTQAAADDTTIVKLMAGGRTYEYHGRSQKVTLVSEPLPDTSGSSPEVPEVTLNLNSAVAADISSSTVPAVKQTEQTPYWAVFPEHVEVTFSDYVHGDAMQIPKIYAFPATDLEEMNQMAADQVRKLEELLIKKPDLATTNPLPFLPLFNANAMFYAQGQYLDFAEGSGIRYLTQYGQAAGPITNRELFYTFQGLTDDGAYYVAAIFPVAQADLPADRAGADARFADGFEAYIQDVRRALATAPADSFTPDLYKLDAMVSSITIH